MYVHLAVDYFYTDERSGKFWDHKEHYLFYDFKADLWAVIHS